MSDSNILSKTRSSFLVEGCEAKYRMRLFFLYRSAELEAKLKNLGTRDAKAFQKRAPISAKDHRRLAEVR